jgi:hypothetical protein
MAQGIFSQYDTQDLNRLAAKGILEKLRTIRQRINVDFTARRIIWELIQNAKDNVAVCNSDEAKVEIKIQLSKERLSFIHNNGFFTNENIRGLIRRYSSSEKDRDYNSFDTPPATTGRFGTGFMTTHLLSEKVTTKGIFYNDNKEYKQFILPIDRTGINEKEIINSIEHSLRSVEDSVTNSPMITHNLTDFKTEFIYELNEEGYKLADIALTELGLCVGPTLINLPPIEKIELNNDNKVTIYKLIYSNKFEKSNLNFEIAELQTITDITRSTYFIVISNEKLKLILPYDHVNDKYKIRSFEHRIPRLFLDFPLVGTEELNLPFIVSSPFFEPTESRDGVSLTGSEDRDTKINSGLLLDAVELYKIFLDEVSNGNKWNNHFNLARIKSPKEKDWINIDWYNKSILYPIRSRLLQVPIVEINEVNRISIKSSENKDQIYFPYASKKEIREVIWKLSKGLFPQNIPVKENIDDWYEIIWDDCYKQNIIEVAKDIEGALNLDNLKSKLNKSEVETLEWLNEYYDLLYFEGKFIDEIIKGTYAIFPNQNGVFKKKTELYIDEDIEEELKNILLLLNVDIRNMLLNKNVIIDNKHNDEQKNKIPFATKDQDFVIQTIIKSLNGNPNASTAVSHLLSLFSEDPDFPDERILIYEFNRKIYCVEIPEKKIIKNWSKSIWDRIDAARILRLVSDISKTKNLDALKTLICEDSIKNTLVWLQSFIEFLVNYGYEEKLNLKEYPILPNQNCEYRVKDDLFLDDGDIHEELKDISKVLGYDIRSELLHKDIFLSLPDSRVKNNQYLAEEIAKLVKPIVKDPDQRVKYGDLFKHLYMWMTQNKELAKVIFDDSYKQRFLLLSDDVIVSNLNKAEMLDELLTGAGLTLEEIKEKIGFVEISEQPNEENETIETHFAFEFTPVDRSLMDKVSEDNSSYFPPGENLSFREKLLQLISTSESHWAGFVYHFTHLENALNIIKDRKILPRNKATFKNSAGNSFINTTLDEIKNFTRFYFRPLTPTQYYNEGLGRETKAGDLPQCPVMIFFKFDLKEVLEKKENQCYVSNGNLRHYPTTKFGNNFEFLKSFNFKNLYCKYGECDHWSFINASQQEFIVKDEFDFSDIENFQIICRTEFDKEVLLNLIGANNPIIDKILVDQSYYYQYNSFVEVESEEHILKVKIPYRGKAESIKIISTKKIDSYIINDTIKSQKSVELETSYDGVYKIYYLNETTRQDWLIYAGRSNNS